MPTTSTKTIFKSKTALVGVISTVAGALSYASPAVATFLQNNAQLIVIGLGVVHTALRFVTKGRVSLFGD